MKKIYTLLTLLLAISVNCVINTAPVNITPKEQLALIVNFHNSTFGVDHLFDQPIEQSKIDQWLEVSGATKQYVLDNSKNVFGVRDSSLVEAIVTVDKANRALANGIKITYNVRNSTKDLIKMAAFFTVIQKKMDAIAKKMQKASFLLKNKQEAQKLVAALALFVATTAAKAAKDTRMGHRSDIVIPMTQPRNIPSKQPIPLLPPTDLPAIYEEEPAFAPPTRPAPAIPAA